MGNSFISLLVQPALSGVLVSLTAEQKQTPQPPHPSTKEKQRAERAITPQTLTRQKQTSSSENQWNTVKTSDVSPVLQPQSALWPHYSWKATQIFSWFPEEYQKQLMAPTLVQKPMPPESDFPQNQWQHCTHPGMALKAETGLCRQHCISGRLRDHTSEHTARVLMAVHVTSCASDRNTNCFSILSHGLWLRKCCR